MLSRAIEKWAVSAGGYSIKKVFAFYTVCFIKIVNMAGLYKTNPVEVGRNAERRGILLEP